MRRRATEQSTLIIQHRLNEQRHTLRPLAEQASFDIGDDGVCGECDSQLTETDVQAGTCAQCGCPIPLITDEGESDVTTDL